MQYQQKMSPFDSSLGSLRIYERNCGITFWCSRTFVRVNVDCGFVERISLFGLFDYPEITRQKMVSPLDMQDLELCTETEKIEMLRKAN